MRRLNGFLMVWQANGGAGEMFVAGRVLCALTATAGLRTALLVPLQMQLLQIEMLRLRDGHGRKWLNRNPLWIEFDLIGRRVALSFPPASHPGRQHDQRVAVPGNGAFSQPKCCCHFILPPHRHAGRSGACRNVAPAWWAACSCSISMMTQKT